MHSYSKLNEKYMYFLNRAIDWLLKTNINATAGDAIKLANKNYKIWQKIKV